MPAWPPHRELTNYADLNGDGIVDLKDFFLFADEFGKTYEVPALRFDGIYRARIVFSGGVTISDIRFYRDGTVRNKSTDGRDPASVYETLDDPTILAVWSGVYHLSGGLLSFTITSFSGNVDYLDTVNFGALDLATHSHINERRAIDQWQFHAVL
ncbi:MAG: hypothetical protein VCE91_16000 [Nitrospinota bacterium]